MGDIFKMEYTELRNAPHFIFNGQSTRDFHVRNVQVDNGLAKDDFLPDRNLTVERTRYSEKSYLLGYTEEPIKFKVKLLFDEHEFKHHNIAALRRWLHTETFEEFKFDNEEESSLNIVMYAMVTGDSNLTHNVINDGYCELEFTTNSSRKYSEIMEDDYDFSKSAADKMLEEFQMETKASSMFVERFARQIKQYTARTNYANIEESFKDKNNDKLPDGWKLISGNVNDMTIDAKTGKMTFNNVHIRKRINMNNGRNYYVRMNGSGGKFRVHETDYNITNKFVTQFKYRRNLLGHSGTFDLDSSGDGIGEGWTQVGTTGSFGLDRVKEYQELYDGGKLSTTATILKGQKYVLIAEDKNGSSTISINNRNFTNNTGELNKFKFIGQTGDKTITISSADPKVVGRLAYIRLYTVTDKEYEEFDSLSEKQVRDKYPYFDAHAYFDLDYTGTTGTLNYIDMWELNDLNKKKLDEGTPIEDIVYVRYSIYKKWLDTSKAKFEQSRAELMDNFDKLASVPKINFKPLRDKIGILFSDVSLVFKALDKGDNMKKYQWDDLQPHYLKLMELSGKINDFMKEANKFIVLNKSAIDNSKEIGNYHVTLYNFGDKPVYPTFYFESTDGSDIMIKNHDTNEQTIISDNLAGEKIEMIGASEQIYTSRPAPYYKYNAHDDVFIRLKEGYNELEFSGNYKMKIVYQFVIL